MNKAKSTLVTVLLAVMLAVIDIGLYILYTPGFYVLTGIFALYGYSHSAADFRGWLCQNDDTREDMTPIDVENREMYDWRQDDTDPVLPDKTDLRSDADKDYLDALVQELHGYEAESKA